MIPISYLNKTEKILYLLIYLAVLFNTAVSLTGYSDSIIGTISSTVLAILGIVFLIYTIINKTKRIKDEELR